MSFLSIRNLHKAFGDTRVFSDINCEVAKGELIPSFVDAVLGRGEPIVSENDVFAAMAICHAADRSLAEGKSVAVRQFGILTQGRIHA